MLGAELEGEAVYDQESHEPLNDAAKLQTSVVVLTTEYLQPAVSLALQLSSELAYKQPDGAVEDDRATEKVTPAEKASA